MPERIQLRRTKGWRKPPGAVVVSRPSNWGNPFRPTRYWGSRVWTVVGPDYNPRLRLDALEARKLAVEQFRVWIPEHWRGRRGLVAIHLRGLNLACWCRLDLPCHADVLLELANEPP